MSIAIGFLLGLYWTAAVIRPPIENTSHLKADRFSHSRPKLIIDRDGTVRENR